MVSILTILSYLFLGLLLFGVFFLLYRKGGSEFLRTSFDEFFYKVSWPSYEELQKIFSLCLVGAALLTLFVFGVRHFLGEAIKNIFYA